MKNHVCVAYHVLALALSLMGATPLRGDDAAEAERRWGDDIRAFEEADKASPPPLGGVLFVGSSSIRLWNLAESFPGLPAINRGFGGSQVSDTLHFADRIVLLYKPRTVVLYAGDNDIAAGESPEQVVEDFRRLVREIHEALPETRIVYIAIKPSIARWHLHEAMRNTNQAIAAICEEDERLVFIDIATPMLNDEGQPRPELFVEDGLHLSETGYRLWTKLVTPHIRPNAGREPEPVQPRR